MKSEVLGPVYWSVLEHGGWTLHLAATSRGLCYVGSANKPFEEMEEWVGKHMRPAKLIRDDKALSPYIGELADYIEGKLVRFTIPCDLVGTPFQRSVWDALRSIPYGETRSYSDIAESIGKFSRGSGRGFGDRRQSGAHVGPMPSRHRQKRSLNRLSRRARDEIAAVVHRESGRRYPGP